ncbi:hypothetical protein [Candidatus Puniceispirillum marinum]|uniref:Uncharacterized protein n=1 Tax=Puniceispirillum marinum (strain IMCC1322) TaxID=488538 RepID=D5BUI8_PUNMI|nr:hypothetical protein [Candidatus Puniceispirillum marinum]ADE39935.1 hypothetical protein SAR116_1692 [Candidatus Puniceispirillum marinum IMCC1322]
MTYGNETNPDQKKIEAAFEMLVSAQNAVSHMMAHNKVRDHISMRDLLRIAKGPKSEADHALLLRVNDDFMARRQLRVILQSQSLASQPQQAAAASTRKDAIQWRSGKAFDLNLIASSKNDGLFYLQLKLKDSEDMARISKAEVLFAESSGQFFSLPLPKIMDGIAQLMIKHGHPMLDAFHDPEAEFFIR